MTPADRLLEAVKKTIERDAVLLNACGVAPREVRIRAQWTDTAIRICLEVETKMEVV